MAQGDRCQFGPLALKSTHKQTGEILCQCGRTAFTANQYFATTGDAGHKGLHASIQWLGQGFSRLILQVGAVDEMLLNAQV
jgi:hypothetical protein